jgi:hypothetical protein
MFQLRGWFFIAVCGTVTAWMLTAIPQRGDGQAQYVGSPEGPGLAAKYVGDAGIERDPNVIFVENFDEPSLDAMKRRWDNVSSADIMSLSDDTTE